MIVSFIKFIIDKLIIFLLRIRKEDEFMFEFLAYRVTQHYLTCDKNKVTKEKQLVPAIWINEVIEILKQTGFNADGYPIVLDEVE